MLIFVVFLTIIRHPCIEWLFAWKVINMSMLVFDGCLIRFF